MAAKARRKGAKSADKKEEADPPGSATKEAVPSLLPPPVETEILVRSKDEPKPALRVPSPVTNCLRCKRKDILVIVALEGKMVGLCPDHFKLDVMQYLP